MHCLVLLWLNCLRLIVELDNLDNHPEILGLKYLEGTSLDNLLIVILLQTNLHRLFFEISYFYLSVVGLIDEVCLPFPLVLDLV